MPEQTDNDRETDGHYSFHDRISKIILLSPDELQTNKLTPLLPSLSLSLSPAHIS